MKSSNYLKFNIDIIRVGDCFIKINEYSIRVFDLLLLITEV